MKTTTETIQAIVSQCKGCRKIKFDEDGDEVCSIYYSPAAKWRAGTCPMRYKATQQTVKSRKKVNPLKDSKRKKREGRK